MLQHLNIEQNISIQIENQILSSIYYQSKHNQPQQIFMSAFQNFINLSPKTHLSLERQTKFHKCINDVDQLSLEIKKDTINNEMFHQFTNNFIFQPFQYPQILQQKLEPPYRQKQPQKFQANSNVQTVSQTSKSIQSSKSVCSHIPQSYVSLKHKQTPLASKMFNSSSMPTNSMALSNLLSRTFLQLTNSQYNFYSFCMLLFPEHSKCLPVDIDILDTIFFQTQKDLVYVYKDSKKGLTKIKNKGKQIYQFFTKRKNNHDIMQIRESKRKMIKENNYLKEFKEKNQDKNNSGAKTTKSIFLTQTFKQGQIPSIIKSLPKLQFDEQRWGQLITPDNTRRKNYENQQLNYVAMLRYKDESFIRLKQSQFKAVFLNPLYANERFKNHNNTQYIQWIPYESPKQDIKSFSMHFSYDTFQKEQLFKFVLKCCSRQNEFLRLDDKQFINQQKNNSNLIKEYLKRYNEQVYLYYLIFEIYAYISMHYNKKLEVANFKFIKYDQVFALSCVQNIIISTFEKEGEFLRADLFLKKKSQDQLQEQKVQKELLSALSTPALREQFNKNLLKSLYQENESENLFQKHIGQILQKQNTKIKQEFVQNINLKLDNIKNTKDLNLSKSVFKLLNPNVSNDFHQMLNDQKKMKKLIMENNQNVYTRKSISNFSIVRSVKRNRPLHSFQKTQNIFQSRTQTFKDFLASTAASGQQTNCKFIKIQSKKKIQKRKLLNQAYINFNKTNFKFTGLQSGS